MLCLRRDCKEHVWEEWVLNFRKKTVDDDDDDDNYSRFSKKENQINMVLVMVWIWHCFHKVNETSGKERPIMKNVINMEILLDRNNLRNNTWTTFSCLHPLILLGKSPYFLLSI